MEYVALKHLHTTAVALSFILLSWRFALMLLQPDRLPQKWLLVTPHVVNSILLLTAIGLAVFIGQYPFVHDWLTEKLLAVVAYIGLGVMCFKGRTKVLRIIAYFGALGWLALAARLAVTKTPLFLV